MYSQVYRHSTKWRLCDKMWIFAMLEEDRLESMTDYFFFILFTKSDEKRRRDQKKVHVSSENRTRFHRWTCLRRHHNDLFYFIRYLRIFLLTDENRSESFVRKIDNEALNQTNINTAAGMKLLVNRKRLMSNPNKLKANLFQLNSFLWPMPRREKRETTTTTRFLTQEASSNESRLFTLSSSSSSSSIELIFIYSIIQSSSLKKKEEEKFWSIGLFFLCWSWFPFDHFRCNLSMFRQIR